MLLSVVLSGLGLAASVAAHVARDADNEDWSVNIIESTMKRFTPHTIGKWEYFVSLYLMGQYVVYKRTGEKRYMKYIQDWADRWFDDEGQFNVTINTLDNMQAGNVMLLVYNETGDQKYKDAAQVVRDRFDDYPRTSDGGFWHGPTLKYQLWADGTFMANPFLERWGHMFGESEYADEETLKQIIVYGDHLQQDNGLLLHAYDESRKAKWADPVTGLSEEQWCRAMGWYGFAITDLLLLVPEDHPARDEVLNKLHDFLAGMKKAQDPETGRWFQVVNRPEDEENWTETSCSAMFTYTADISLKQGWLKDEESQYQEMVKRAHAGVLEQVRKNDNGLTDVFQIVVGTTVGDVQFYYNRPRKTNDLHGLGAVLLMNEQVIHSGRITLGT
jgi:unsaturated rhamnogalacturonyl hydrolase